jgi:proline dehydrogenase
VILRAVLLALSTRRRIGQALDASPTAQRFVRRFVAGTRPEEALAAIADLNRRGLRAAVTYLGENVATAADAERATAMYLHLLDEIRRRGLDAAPSVKLTHLGLDVDPALGLANVRRVAEGAGAAGTRVWIDMESSAYTDRTLDLYAGLRPTFANVACVLQSYLRRTPDDLERMVALGASLRLCKGAYREPPALAFPAKRDVDAAYARLMDRVFTPEAQAAGVYVAFATHDDRLQARVRDRATAAGVGIDRFEIQMLHGIRQDLHEPLRAAGVPLRVLVPFGEDWYGYFMRRLAERPANLGFFLRQLVRGRR